MPTYDYECTECSHITERFHGMTARPRVKCPECGSRTRKMLGTGAGLIFKGGGFYETDYRSDSYKAGAKADAPSTSSTSGDGDSSKTPKTSKKSESSSKSPASKSTSKTKAQSGSNGST